MKSWTLTAYVYDNKREQSSIEFFEANHDSADWIKLVDDESTSFCRVEIVTINKEKSDA